MTWTARAARRGDRQSSSDGRRYDIPDRRRMARIHRVGVQTFTTRACCSRARRAPRCAKFWMRHRQTPRGFFKKGVKTTIMQPGCGLRGGAHNCRRRRHTSSASLVKAMSLLLGIGLLSCSCHVRDARLACSSSFAVVAAAPQHLIARDNARDLLSVLTGYTDDVVWLPPSGDVLQGKQAIRARYEQMFSQFAIAMSAEVMEAKADGAVGFARGSTNGVLTPVGGGTPVAVKDKFLALVRCENGIWRVSHLMWSPIASPK